MAVGKGRTARKLAQQTGMYTVDTDDLIETLVKMKIRKIFKKHGEPHFRDLEKQTGLWLEKNVTNTIVSTGGGFFKVPNINKTGKVVYLHSTLDAILDAVHAHPKANRKIKKRPLLQDFEKARALYEQRLPLYRNVASLEVDVARRTIEEVAIEIQERL